MTTTPRLGRSQQAVYEYLKTHGPATGQQVGDALYDSTSSWGSSKLMALSGHRATAKHRRDWANKSLKALAKRGLIEALDEGQAGKHRAYNVPDDTPKSPPQAARHHSPFGVGA